MKEQKLIEKVKDYLLASNTVFEESSIEYIGIRENYVVSSEEPKDYYFLSFEVVVDKANKYSTKSYFVFIDKTSERIRYVLGPQSTQKI